MASGSQLPVKFGGVFGYSANATTISNMPTGTPSGTALHQRIFAIWLGSTSVTFSAAPAGWSKIADVLIGQLRWGLFFCPRWDINSTYSSSSPLFSWSASVSAVGTGAFVQGVDTANPLLAGPVTVSGTSTTATSFTIPSLTVDTSGMMLWDACARYTASASARPVNVFADTAPIAGSTSTGSTGLNRRLTGWHNGAAADGALGYRTPNPTTTKAVTITAGSNGYSGVAVALRPAEQPAAA